MSLPWVFASGAVSDDVHVVVVELAVIASWYEGYDACWLDLIHL